MFNFSHHEHPCAKFNSKRNKTIENSDRFFFFFPCIEPNHFHSSQTHKCTAQKYTRPSHFSYLQESKMPCSEFWSLSFQLTRFPLDFPEHSAIQPTLELPRIVKKSLSTSNSGSSQRRNPKFSKSETSSPKHSPKPLQFRKISARQPPNTASNHKFAQELN